MKPETIIACFERDLNQIVGITPKTKDLVLHAVQEKTENRQLNGDDNDPIQKSLNFQIIRAEIIKENWHELPEDERLLLCFPAAPHIGQTMNIPKRGKGTVLRRTLSDRLGLEIAVRMEDGSIFNWEFFD